MKKYKSNRAKKLLLASLIIPVAVSTLPTEMVSANTEIPTLNVYELNGSPKLEWATEILQENILTKTSFEDGDELPFIMNQNFSGQQSFSTEMPYNGKKSLKIGKTTPNLGNAYYDLATESNMSEATFTNRKYIKNGEYLSVTVKVKADNKAQIFPIGAGGNADRQKSMKEYLNSNHSFKFKENVSVGQNYFYIDNPKEFKDAITNTGKVVGFNIYTVTNKSKNGNYFFNLIKSIDESTGKVTLERGFQENFTKGEDVLAHEYVSPVQFENRTIQPSNDWQTVSFNAFVYGGDFYDTLSRGFDFRIRTISENNTFIDDITFGYATEVEIYRDGQSVYKGFLSDFHDTTIKDNVKPNKVSIVKGSIASDFNINFNVTKPADNGAKANYQIESIAKSGMRSALSTPKEIEIKTDVVKYKYSIGNQSSNTPSIETTTLNDIVVPLKSINLETDYLHIQSIDKNGNISDVESFKVKDIIDVSNLEELYDKIKELEKSNDYNDFIDFIEEIENLYGDNLPQDLKEMIDNLGKHHGVNTSFLLLEEGDFRLTTSDIYDFGKVKLTAKKQTIMSNFLNEFNVIDARGTQEGWHVSVSATPFTVETFDGFIGTPHQLPVGSLALNSVNHVEQVGTVHNSQLPSVELNELTAIDGENQTVNLLNASKNKGMGEFNFTFTPDALALIVDAVTAKIDTVNYPEQNTPYASTVTWDLVSGPQI